GAGGGGEAPVPSGTRTRLASFPSARPRRASTAASANPTRTRAGTPRATAVASRLASRVPVSQKKWRYARAWYFQLLRQVMAVRTSVTGAAWTRAGSEAASASTARQSPGRGWRSADSPGAQGDTPAAGAGPAPAAN